MPSSAGLHIVGRSTFEVEETRHTVASKTIRQIPNGKENNGENSRGTVRSLSIENVVADRHTSVGAEATVQCQWVPKERGNGCLRANKLSPNSGEVVMVDPNAR